MDVVRTRKRKELSSETNQNKRLKGKESADSDTIGNEQDLAVAVSQPCLGL